jgi:hypothetical protein
VVVVFSVRYLESRIWDSRNSHLEHEFFKSDSKNSHLEYEFLESELARLVVGGWLARLMVGGWCWLWLVVVVVFSVRYLESRIWDARNSRLENEFFESDLKNSHFRA